jgi:hypothetical protein
VRAHGNETIARLACHADNLLCGIPELDRRLNINEPPSSKFSDFRSQVLVQLASKPMEPFVPGRAESVVRSGRLPHTDLEQNKFKPDSLSKFFDARRNLLREG